MTNAHQLDAIIHPVLLIFGLLKKPRKILKTSRISLTLQAASPSIIECFWGQHRGGAILLHFCGSLDPFFMQQNESFLP